jgi:hypothetical protein
MRLVCVLSFAFAIAATATEAASGPPIDYALYLQSDAIVRVRVVSATADAATVDVKTVYLGNVSRGRLTVRQDPYDALKNDDDSFLFLCRVEGTFQVINEQFAYDSFEDDIRDTLASLPGWQPHGAISLISFADDPVITLKPRDFPGVRVWTAYRNETDQPFDLPLSLTHPQSFARAADGRSLLREHEFALPKTECGEVDNTWNVEGSDIVDLGFIHLEPHETIVNPNFVLIEPQRPREEIEITIDDGLYRFDPVHVVVLSEPAEPPAPCKAATSGARPSPRS